ncbi:MAG TPA: MBL fold metallo-hydrolase [Vicinamibacterales bacterium]|jgi:Metallo-beta-lactamase superfamily|nr:MBL fold metallo-hydrolase [Vicinamibacterales bacterium]
MAKRLVMLVAVFTFVAATVHAQDARAVLQASLKAMGGENLKTIEYSGSGWSSQIGQTYGAVDGDWPHFEVAGYTRIIDYDARWSREDYTRRQGSYPTFGRAPMPETHVTAILSGNYAWDMNGNTPVPLTRMYLDGVPYNVLRQLEVALTPHGALKAALAATDAAAITTPIVGPSDFGLSQFGRKVTIVSFTLMGKYKMNVTVNDQNLVELVDTWFPNPVYGDMDYEMRYTMYKDFNGVKFPQLVHVHQGDPRLNPAHNYYEFKITDVKGNVPVMTMPVPETVRTATLAPVRAESQRLADGVWAITGGTHNSMVVEFKDFVAVVEAPNNEARSLAVIAEANRLVPNKPIRYLVNTHHHFDHAGGLRTFLAQGTAIVTHESNKQYYLDIMFYPAPRELDPDRMAKYSPMYMISRRPAPIETVGGDTRATAPYVITDGVRMLEVFHVQDMAYELGDPSLRQGNHAQDMLMAYLPKERILYNADLYSPPAQGAAAPAANAANRTLYQNILKLKLDVATHVPTHGRVGNNDEFVKIFGKAGNTN